MKKTVEWKDPGISVIPNIPTYYGQHPSLKLLKALPRAPEHPTRIKILEFRRGGVVDIDIANLTQLNAYWTEPTSSSCKGRVYLIEDISLPYIAALEKRFTIDPHFFVEYIKLDLDRTQNFLDGYHTMRRLASLRPRLNFATFVYHEIRSFEGSAPRREEYEILTRTNVTRLVTTVDHRTTHFTGLVRRNMSVWWRKLELNDGEDDEAWDTIILVDASMSDKLIIRPWSALAWRSTIAINSAYLEGYLDFSDWPALRPGPPPFCVTPNHSMVDDITNYWKQCSQQDLDHALTDPRYSPIFAHRIIASHWNLQLEYLVSVVSDLEKGLLRFEQMDAHAGAESITCEVRALRVLLSDVNSWRRRVYFYLEQMKWNIEVLGMPSVFPSTPNIQSIASIIDQNALEDSAHDDGTLLTLPDTAATLTTLDFTTQLTSLRLLQQRIQSLLPTVMGAFTLLEAQRSVLRADLTIRLSGVALVFVPLSFSASLLSMSEDYVPGKRLFWVYFAVAVPLVAVLFAWAFWGSVSWGLERVFIRVGRVWRRGGRRRRAE